ncbi:MAG: glycine cleavage system protein GcvH [Acidimicrobiaceae bacterium]|nr:glycine cleavage system protein GcvH [Acidimicrobiaceae bacterium]MXW75238.1 glycine cleavage system protein GcvH [Acidimicrobiaceae bacterium]MYA74049.1 glycine cleavage system protein GcvH [Acidimicrobiaceae bacterium]MYD06319.1 glycine cleavage system protein GcvH [Acidimicrobiaceae bacterium]MYG55353.1 glycine cleavage system protein GcvH [Acidimicrobiaceae bacterium]
MDIPDDLLYSKDHEWVSVEGDAARVGITDYAQDALGDVVYVDLPRVGDQVEAGSSFSEVESTKSVSELYAPVSGTISAVNDDLADAPERINEDPYGEGWIIVISMSSETEIDALLDAVAYGALIES